MGGAITAIITTTIGIAAIAADPQDDAENFSENITCEQLAKAT